MHAILHVHTTMCNQQGHDVFFHDKFEICHGLSPATVHRHHCKTTRATTRHLEMQTIRRRANKGSGGRECSLNCRPSRVPRGRGRGLHSSINWWNTFSWISLTSLPAGLLTVSAVPLNTLVLKRERERQRLRWIKGMRGRKRESEVTPNKYNKGSRNIKMSKMKIIISIPI